MRKSRVGIGVAVNVGVGVGVEVDGRTVGVAVGGMPYWAVQSPKANARKSCPCAIDASGANAIAPGEQPGTVCGDETC